MSEIVQTELAQARVALVARPKALVTRFGFHAAAPSASSLNTNPSGFNTPALAVAAALRVFDEHLDAARRRGRRRGAVSSWWR